MLPPQVNPPAPFAATVVPALARRQLVERFRPSIATVPAPQVAVAQAQLLLPVPGIIGRGGPNVCTILVLDSSEIRGLNPKACPRGNALSFNIMDLKVL